MPLIAHDHAYEHPHHGVGLREEQGNVSGSGGLVMPVPVPIAAPSVHAGDRTDDEGNPHTLPRIRNMPSPATSNRSGISTAFPTPQPLSPTEPLPPAMMNRRGIVPRNRDGKGSALRDSVVADEEFDTSFFPASQAFPSDAQAGGGRASPPSPTSTAGPSRRGTATATDDDEIVKSPTMMNPGRTKRRNNRNKKKKRNVRLAEAAAGGGGGPAGGQTTAHPDQTTTTHPTPGVTTTSPTRARRPSQFAHTTPGPATGEKTSRNMAGVGYHWLSNTGSEPGVDVTQDVGDYVNLTDPVRVTIVDYSSDGQGTRVDVPGKKLKMWLNSADGERPVQPSAGTEGDHHEKKRSVRWINVDGINFETLKFLTLRYGLHPLAVEDTLRASNNPRSKLDFYANHLYLQMLVQHIRSEDQDEIRAAGSRKARRAAAAAAAAAERGRSKYGSTGERSPAPPGSGESEEEGSNDEDEDVNGDTMVDHSADKTYQSSGHAESGIVLPRARHRHRRHHTGSSGKRAAAAAAENRYNEQPTGWRRLLGFGRGKGMTSLPEGVEGVFEPIQTIQPGHANTPTRNAHSMTIDSLAAQYMIPLRRSVLSVFMMRDVVDIAIEITQAFESEILKMEAGCLVNPQMESVRHLHIISSQLTRLKRTLSPLAHVLYTLRDRDSQRALVSALYGSSHGSSHGESKDHRTSGALGFDSTHSTGYISQTTKVYLSDVIGMWFSALPLEWCADLTVFKDHIDTMLTSLDQYLMTCDHLTDYIFNMLSFITNESMERLSLVTVIFLRKPFALGYTATRAHHLLALTTALTFMASFHSSYRALPLPC
ncbi:hypothetical protein QFC22_001471 [Naganishia vaughanmartiniae]|uniref:Uncharacterized protein n=1 Tax=Naganishia vaughanmartiniae TaxID=1424756 RepID=A0ACC2XI05_9TREE|nr:hypothetical protein QFC22_001471 [Naganishia vaughanmartiniae]